MKNLKLVLVLTILVISCGGNNTPIVEADNTKINGPLSNYLEVVKGEYEITEDWGAHISIKLKALKSFPEEELNNKEIELSLVLLNDKGMPVSGTGKLSLESDEKDKLINLLKTGSGEDVFKFRSYLGDYKQEEHGKNVSKFTITSIIKELDIQEETTNTSINSQSLEDDTSLSECDQLLEEYEAFADSYIEFMNEYKKNPNDLSILNEYAEMVQKASQMQSKAKNCNDPKFAQRIVEITNKITSAAY